MKKSEIKSLRALSLIQPWAHCVVFEGKNVENRNKVTHMRGTVAIHASKKVETDRFYWLKHDFGISLEPDEVDYGAIVGFAEIVDVVTARTKTAATTKWFSGKYGYVLTNIVTLKKPVPVKGALGFWRLKGRALKECLDQLSDRQVARFKSFGY